MKSLLRFLLACLGVCIAIMALALGGPTAQERFGALAQTQKAEEAIGRMLKQQAEDWNRGDVEAFMLSYWKSSELTFAGSGGIERGWENVLARYKRVYPDRSAMGHLTFSQLEIRPLADDAALVLGHWQLQREKDSPGGIFSLVVRRFPEGWRIIHDHTSAVTAPLK